MEIYSFSQIWVLNELELLLELVKMGKKKVQSQLLIIENRINWRGKEGGGGREGEDGSDGVKW